MIKQVIANKDTQPGCLNDRFHVLDQIGKGSFASVNEQVGNELATADTLKKTIIFRKVNQLNRNTVEIKHIFEQKIHNKIEYHLFYIFYQFELHDEFCVKKNFNETINRKLLIYNLRQLHEIGFAHCDIKLDNILLYSNNFSSVKSSIVSLIDFGSVKKLPQLSGTQQAQQETDSFEGNLNFSSLRQMYLRPTQRRDDITSVLYLLIYLKLGKLPWFIGRGVDKRVAFQQIRGVKKLYHQEINNRLSKQNGLKRDNKLNIYEELLNHTDLLKSDSELNYDYYIKKLARNICQKGEIVDWVMDWTTQNQQWFQSYRLYTGILDLFTDNISNNQKNIRNAKSLARHDQSSCSFVCSEQPKKLKVSSDLEIEQKIAQKIRIPAGNAEESEKNQFQTKNNRDRLMNNKQFSRSKKNFFTKHFPKTQIGLQNLTQSFQGSSPCDQIGANVSPTGIDKQLDFCKNEEHYKENMQAHFDLSFENLSIQVPKSLDIHPLQDNYNNFEENEDEIPDLDIEEEGIHECLIQYSAIYSMDFNENNLKKIKLY
eukprot:403340493